MSTAPNPAYDDVLAGANRLLDVFATAFEKWWQRKDNATRERLLETGVRNNDAFSMGDAEKVRKGTRDPVPICQLLDAIAGTCGLDANDATTIRQYRSALHHRNKTAKGDFIFLIPDRMAGFLDAVMRMVKGMRSRREETQVMELAHFMRGALAGTVDAGEALPPLPLWSDADVPRPPRVEDPPYALPVVTRSTRKPLDPEDPAMAQALSPDQAAVVDAIAAWFAGPPERRHFAVAGAAGTGKTTVTGAVIRRLALQPAQVALLAPTGKAVEALKVRLPRGWKGRARTMASFLWRWQFTGYNGEDAKFTNRGDKPVDPVARLIVVDEASMVTKADFKALFRYGRVLYTGDPHQLPPVVEDDALQDTLGACGVLDAPDATLQRVHRQDHGSSIHTIANESRGGLQPAFGPSADGRVLHLSEEQGHFGVEQLDAILDRADVVLTQRNSMRVMINEYVRRRRGFMTSPVDFVPKAGEILVCAENTLHPDKRIKVANGERMVVKEFRGRQRVRTDDSGVEDFVVRAHPEGRPTDEAEWLISSQMLSGDQVRGSVVVTEHVSGPRSSVLRADWGYALTVHKAQGSEWSCVVVVDDLDPDHQVPLHKWYYVAYSRASEQLIILKVRRDTLLFTPAAAVAP